MKQNTETLITNVELSEDREHLSLHTRNAKDCDSLWAQLVGQVKDRTEGRMPILYDIPANPPESPVLEVEIDTDQVVVLLKYLETLRFLSEGTNERIHAQIARDQSAKVISSK